jgi:hypothetical protein
MPADLNDQLPCPAEGEVRRSQPALFVLFIFLKQGDQALGERLPDWIVTRTPSRERCPLVVRWRCRLWLRHKIHLASRVPP